VLASGWPPASFGLSVEYERVYQDTGRSCALLRCAGTRAGTPAPDKSCSRSRQPTVSLIQIAIACFTWRLELAQISQLFLVVAVLQITLDHF
jgi:hypothetical protein